MVFTGTFFSTINKKIITQAQPFYPDTLNPIIKINFDDTATLPSGESLGGTDVSTLQSTGQVKRGTYSGDFDGTRNLTISNTTSWFTNPMTISFWHYSDTNTDTDNYELLVGSSSYPTYFRFYKYVRGSGKYSLYVWDGGSNINDYYVDGGTTMDNVWTHIVLRVSTNTVNVVVNGNTASPRINGTLSGVQGGGTMQLYGTGVTQYETDRYLDEFYVYDRLLTDTEVQNIYNAY